MKVGDLVKRINWHQLGPSVLVGGPPRPASEKEYPAEPMRGIIIDKVGVVRSAIAGKSWDWLILWESGRTSQLSERGIEKIRRSHEQQLRSTWEEEGGCSEETLEKLLQSARETDSYMRLRYGCQCRGCDDYYHRNMRKFWLGRPRTSAGDEIPSPDCEHGEANESR